MGVLRGCNADAGGTRRSDMKKNSVLCIPCGLYLPWSQLQMMNVREDSVALLPVTDLLGDTESFEPSFLDEA